MPHPPRTPASGFGFYQAGLRFLALGLLLLASSAYAQEYVRSVTGHWRTASIGVPFSVWQWPSTQCGGSAGVCGNIFFIGAPYYYVRTSSAPPDGTFLAGPVEIIPPSVTPRVYQLIYQSANPTVGTRTGSVLIKDNAAGGVQRRLDVMITLTNTAPVAGDFTAAAVLTNSVDVPVLVLSNSTDANGDPLKLTGTSATAPAGCGTLVPDFDFAAQVQLGKFTPAANFTGTCTMLFTVDDTQQPSANAATFSVQVNAASSLPVLSISPTTAGETSTLGTDSNFSFALNLSAPAPAGGVSGTFSTSDGSGVDPAEFAGTSSAGGNDYAPQTNVAFSIPAGSSSTTVTVPVRGDLTYEVDENFNVTLNSTGLTGAMLGTSTAVGTITNDDGSPTVQASSPSVTEGTGPGTTTLTFALSLSNPTQRSCNFAYSSLAIATATGGGVDFDDVPTTSVDLSGVSQTASVNVNIIRDAITEVDETFDLDIFGEPFACNLPAANPTGTIIDDDAVVASATVQINSNQTLEGNVGTSNLAFTVTRSNATTAFSVPYTVANVTTNTSDYTLAGGTLTFAVGGPLTQTITALVNGDTTVEPDETFTVTLGTVTDVTGATQVLGGAGSGTGTIQNDDFPKISISNASATEGAVMAVTLSLNTPALSAVNGTVSTNPNGVIRATAGVDYTALNNVPFTIAAGTSSTTVNLTTLQDLIFEGPEVFDFVITSVSNADLAGAANSVGTILDNDAPPAIGFNNVSLAEGSSGAATNFPFTATLTGNAFERALDFAVTVSGGTATSGTDYNAVTAVNLPFQPGDTFAAFVVRVIPDFDVEPDETFQITAANLPGAAASTAGIGTIVNDDSASLSIADAAVLENAGSVALTITANVPAPVGGVLIDYATIAGTALAGSDYTLSTGTAMIAAGATTVSVSVPILNDALVEVPETFIVRISNARTGPLMRAVNYSIAKADGSVRITDDDSSMAISANPATLVYGQATTLTATVQCGATPTGSVSFANGATSLGSGTLVASATPGTAVATRNLPLLNVGSYSVIASYAGVAPCGTSASALVSIIVRPADTSLVLSGPARSRINQPIAFTGTLSVVAPGGGTPSGIINPSSVGVECSYASPSASSCNLTWNTLGAKFALASFLPGSSNYHPSTSNLVETFVFALADLDVSLTNQVSTYQPDQVLIYTLILNNRGPDLAPGVRLRSALPAGLLKVRWTCASVGGAICPEAGGVEDINALVLTLPANGQLIYTLSGSVSSPAPGQIRATAAVTLPSDGTIEDPVLTNQSATDTDAIDGLLRDGFEG